jgi:hypothetical protein
VAGWPNLLCRILQQGKLLYFLYLIFTMISIELMRPPVCQSLFL